MHKRYLLLHEAAVLLQVRFNVRLGETWRRIHTWCQQRCTGTPRDRVVRSACSSRPSTFINFRIDFGFALSARSCCFCEHPEESKASWERRTFDPSCAPSPRAFTAASKRECKSAVHTKRRFCGHPQQKQTTASKNTTLRALLQRARPMMARGDVAAYTCMCCWSASAALVLCVKPPDGTMPCWWTPRERSRPLPGMA